MPRLHDAYAPPILNPEMGQVPGEVAVPKKREVKPEPESRGVAQPNVLTIRGRPTWKQWLDDFAAKMRTKPTALIDLALAKLAQEEGFREPPPRI
jgi:hypothetical protein